jgi:signal transduction histidine kinase
MGMVTIVAMLSTYLLAQRELAEEPELVALVVIVVTVIFFVTGHFIIDGFTRIAELSRMKSEFVSITSHQLRSPLAGLQWSIESILSGKYGALNQRQQDFFTIIKESTDRMIKLVSDLLDVSRVETKEVVIHFTKVSFQRVIQEVVADILPLAKASNVDIVLNVPKNIREVSADELRLRIVVQNIIDNAVKYIMGRGTVTVELYEKDNAVTLKVSDTGVGIPEQDQKKIFEKFFRAENVKKLKTQGTGLGMFITRSYVVFMRGTLRMESAEGRGTTFWISFPLAA